MNTKKKARDSVEVEKAGNKSLKEVLEVIASIAKKVEKLQDSQKRLKEENGNEFVF